MRTLFSLKTAVLSFSILALAGCAEGGNNTLADQNAQTVHHQIQTGVTTKAQVRSMFGDPEKTKYLGNGDAVWEYAYKKVDSDVRNYIPVVNWLSSGTHGYKKELVIEFNKKGVVTQYSMNKAHVTSSGGILG